MEDEPDPLLPPELRQLDRYKPWWYAGTVACLAASGIVTALAPRDPGTWLSWVADLFFAAQATLTLYLVILTYRLFAVAMQVTDQNERIHRISQLPLVVAEIEPLSLEPHPGYRVRVFNEGSGPALDIEVSFDYHLRAADPDAVGDAHAASDARLRIGVLNKATHTGLLAIDARGIMLSKPWKDVQVAAAAAPSDVETRRLLAPYSLRVSITYKDIYDQRGRTTYEALHAADDVGIELRELVVPAVRVGSAVKPIAFRRDPPSSR